MRKGMTKSAGILAACLLTAGAAACAGDNHIAVLPDAVKKLKKTAHSDKRAVRRQARRDLRRLLRSFDAEDNVKNAARATLAAAERRAGKLNKAAGRVNEFADYEKKNLTGGKLFCFLEYVRCLSAHGDVREGLKRLRYATEHTEGLAHSRTLATQADVQLNAKAFDKAIKTYRNALNYGNDYYRPKKVSATAATEKVPGARHWKDYRSTLKERIKEARTPRPPATTAHSPTCSAVTAIKRSRSLKRSSTRSL